MFINTPGALGIGSSEYPPTRPLIAFEHLSLYIQKHLGRQSVALCGILWKAGLLCKTLPEAQRTQGIASLT